MQPWVFRKKTDAMLDVYYFMAGKAAGPGEDVAAPAPDKDRFAGQLAAGYAGLKATRPDLPAELREKALAQWSELPPVQPLVERVRELRRFREGHRVGKLMREEETRQMLFHMRRCG
jgi:hypothetical protein